MFEDHMFEIYTMISEIHDNVDLVLGIKKFVYLEAEINMTELKFMFLNRSVPTFSVHKEMIKPKEENYMKV